MQDALPVHGYKYVLGILRRALQSSKFMHKN